MTLEKFDPIKLTVLGEEKNFRYTLYSFAQYKRLTGKSMLVEFDPTDPDSLCSYVWAGIIPDDSSFDGEIVDGAPPEIYKQFRGRFLKNQSFEHLETYVKAIEVALRRALPQAKETKKKDK